MPEFISSLEDGSIYDMPGLFGAYPFSDVAFFYRDNILYHYTGIIGGWHLHKTTPCATENEAKNIIDKWLDEA